MKNYILLFVFATALLLGGCSSKSYYKPTEIVGKVSFDDRLPAKIKAVNANGATLENGLFVDKNGVNSLKLDKGFEFLSDANGTVLAADENGILRSYQKGKEPIDIAKFDVRIVAAAVADGFAAVILADNTEILYNIQKKEIAFRNKSDDAISVDTKIVSPKFLTDLVIFPTLDGKLLIVDTKENKIVKDIIISSEKQFNNVIFFDIIDDRLIAATGSRVISINPKFVNFLDVECVDVVFIKNAVYILTKDGRIMLTDADLKVQKEKKFAFARFIGAIFGKYIYAVEKEGYLIATDINLVSSNVFQFQSPFYGLFSSSLDSALYSSGDSIYYDDKQFKLAN